MEDSNTIRYSGSCGNRLHRAPSQPTPCPTCHPLEEEWNFLRHAQQRPTQPNQEGKEYHRDGFLILLQVTYFVYCSSLVIIVHCWNLFCKFVHFSVSLKPIILYCWNLFCTFGHSSIYKWVQYLRLTYYWNLLCILFISVPKLVSVNIIIYCAEDNDSYRTPLP